jgi:hypothetical protein
MLKVALGHLRGLPGAPKSAKKALCSSGNKGKPDDFFPIPVTPGPLKSKIMKILFQQLFSSCIGFAIYQLSPKNIEKCQKKALSRLLKIQYILEKSC